MNVGFFYIFEKCSDKKVHESLFSGSPFVPIGRTEGRTDIMKLIVVFGNFANAPKILIEFPGLRYL